MHLRFLRQAMAMVLLLVGHRAMAQFSENLRPDRPGQAESAYAAGNGVFILQTGVTREGSDDGNDRQGDAWASTTVLRLGLTETFEARTTLQWRRDKQTFGQQENTTSGLAVWDIGARFHIFSGEGSQPSFGMQANVALNVGDEAYQAEAIAPSLVLMHEQPLSGVFTLATNWGVGWNGDDNDPAGRYVVNVSFPLAERWGGFVENYGQVANQDLDTRWDAGISFLPNAGLQLDFSAGYGSNDSLSDWFVDAGVSWRAPLK